MTLTRVALVVLATALAFSVAHAQEKKIKREQLPPAVEKTVATESQGATIKGFATEIEHGTKFYEASLVVDGRTLPVDGNGFFVGPTLFDQVQTDMSIYRDEIFGPVLCVVRVFQA